MEKGMEDEMEAGSCLGWYRECAVLKGICFSARRAVRGIMLATIPTSTHTKP